MERKYCQICNEEKIISVIDLCFFVLKGWKCVILCTVISAILVAGISFAKSSKEYEVKLKSSTGDMREEFSLSEDEKKAFEEKMLRIHEYQENVNEREYYLQNSIKAKLNPNKFYQGTVSYVISSRDSEYVLKMVELCKAKLFTEDNFEKLSKTLSETTDAVLLKEVVLTKEEIYAEEAKFVIEVQHFNEKDCEKMLSFWKNEMNEVASIFKNGETDIYIECVRSQINSVSDSALMEVSSIMMNERNLAYDAALAWESNMSEVEKKYYAMRFGDMQNDVEKSIDIKKPTVDKKMVFVVAGLGAFAVAGLYAVYYLFSGYVHTKEELESWISAPVLNMESDLEMNATMLAGILGEKNADKIYLTSSLKPANEVWMREFSEVLKSKNIETIIGADISDNPSALQKAVETGALVLVEKCYKSKEKDIRETIVKANSCGVRVCSVILEK